LKRKTNMSIDENVLYNVDKIILDTRVFGNRSEMFEYFSGFLNYFDKSFKNISVEKAVEKMYKKIHGPGLISLDMKKTNNKQQNVGSEEQKNISSHSSQRRTRINDTFQEREVDVEKQVLTREEQEIREGISNFTGGFFK